MRDGIHVLMVTSDPWLVATFTQISREVGIEAHAIAGNWGMPRGLSAAKYEAVLLDFDTVHEATPILTALRQSRSNENAVVFAVATDAALGQIVLENGANLILERPLEPKQIRRALYASYDLMVRERRRYFRCAVDLPVLLIRASSGVDFRCTSMNISSNGIALSTPSPFRAGEEVQVVLFLRDAELAIRALGTVVWDDKRRKAGIGFKCTDAQHQSDLDAWLDAQLLMHLGFNRPDRGIST